MIKLELVESLWFKKMVQSLEERLEYLERRISELEAENKALRSENEKLKLENAELKERLGLTSKNSSIPSSKELYKSKKPEKKSSGRKRGGQDGHKGHFRKTMEADQIVNIEIENTICQCGGELCMHGKAHTHQTIDIPAIKPYVTDYQLTRYRCNKCGKKKKAALPAGVSKDTFGDNISVVISALTAFYKNSRRDVQNILRNIFNVDISLGSISNREGKVSEKCKEAYEDLESTINNSNVVHIDETSHSNSGKRGWCWLFASEDATLIKLEQSRGKKVLKASPFGENDSIYITDRYAAYNYFDEEMRQVCWAHLRRDFARFTGSSYPEVREYGIYLEQMTLELFALRNALFAEQIDILYFKRRACKLRRRAWYYLNQIAYLPQAQSASRKAKTIMKAEDMMWRFLYDPYSIPLTNNHAEQQIRHYVVYRKNSYFTQSERGNCFLERLMSLFLTWKKTDQNPFLQLSNLVTA